MKMQIIGGKSDSKQTPGEGAVINSQGHILFPFKTLELPWLDNQRQISCIPKGNYTVKKRFSSKYGHHFHVLNVPGRDMILIHHGNFYRDTLGCIIPGRSFADLDGDGFRDVTHSKQTMQKLNELLQERFELVIL